MASYEEFLVEIERLVSSSVFFLVREKKLGRPIGYVLGYHINQWDGWMFVGGYVEEPYRLRGHGGEATLLGIDYVFQNFPLRMIYVEIYEFAESVLRLSKAIGFEEVGFQPGHFWHGDRFWGVYRLVLSRELWERAQQRFSDLVHIQEMYAQRLQS